MYAVIATGGKQYKVAVGDILKIEKLDKTIGESVEFPILLSASATSPVAVVVTYLPEKTVKAEIIEQGRHKKIKIIKFRRRKHHKKQMGHRQYYTAVKISHIGGTA